MNCFYVSCKKICPNKIFGYFVLFHETSIYKVITACHCIKQISFFDVFVK